MKPMNLKLSEIATRLQRPDFDRVLVACHRSPDGDACGSAHALAMALRKMGKLARVFCPDSFGAEFSYITEQERDLPFFEPEHFITVDVAAPDMLCGADFTDRIHVVLDHHRINTVRGEDKYVDPTSASCGQIVLELIEAMGVTPDRPMAKALYTAMATDTGCFRYSNTDKRVHLAVASLCDCVEAGDFYRINKALFETKSPLQLKLEGFALNRFSYAEGGRVAYLAVSLEEQRELGAAYEDLDCLIGVIRQPEGVLLAICAKEREAGTYKVSVRSEEGIDASAFCASFGGGGHIAAAGCTLYGTKEEVVSRLLARAGECLP